MFPGAAKFPPNVTVQLIIILSFFFFFILLIVSFWLIWLRIISINLVASYKKHEPQKVKNNLFHFFNYYSMKTAEPTNRRQNQRQNSEEFLVFSLMWISTETQVTIIFTKTKTTDVGVMSSLMSHVSSQMLTSAMWLTVQWQKCQKKKSRSVFISNNIKYDYHSTLFKK